MTTRKSKEILNGLKSKGFQQSNTDHKKLILFVNGQKTSIRTKVSHGKKEYGDQLLALVKRQLKLDSSHQLLELIDCPMSTKEYVEYLELNNHI